ncbi:hypothetical protein DQ04_09401010 [Trypanosoma grayi]|uniref:hypothetical protein n=1 Tax=Trypanosoma grayi TaxID=71804 RepID=UPI0004F41E0D|nr:hypothetical protein DQ04_09401010 [Trypanosoma grayi]KEG07571.1 hypothetical protein DQ04_09401010 [Trypanosoma grayi]
MRNSELLLRYVAIALGEPTMSGQSVSLINTSSSLVLLCRWRMPPLPSPPKPPTPTPATPPLPQALPFVEAACSCRRAAESRLHICTSDSSALSRTAFTLSKSTSTSSGSSPSFAKRCRGLTPSSAITTPLGRPPATLLSRTLASSV